MRITFSGILEKIDFNISFCIITHQKTTKTINNKKQETKIKRKKRKNERKKKRR